MLIGMFFICLWLVEQASKLDTDSGFKLRIAVFIQSDGVSKPVFRIISERRVSQIIMDRVLDDQNEILMFLVDRKWFSIPRNINGTEELSGSDPLIPTF